MFLFVYLFVVMLLVFFFIFFNSIYGFSDITGLFYGLFCPNQPSHLYKWCLHVENGSNA